MKKPTIIPMVLFVCSLVFLIPAIFAELIGLDKNPGDWSRARIAVFAVGILFTALAGIYYYCYKQIVTLTSTIWTSIQRQQIVIWFFNNRIVQHSLKLANGYLFTLLIPIFILIVYTWLASSGTWTRWKSPTYYYSSLADAFLNGHLHLSIQPDPKLLALENPYDASNRAGIEIPADLSLYQGKFYMYWGPAPALLLAVLQSFIHGQIGDLFLTFAFAYGIFGSLSAFISVIWNYYFSTLPKWTFHLSVLLGGLTVPIILLRHNFDAARIYEASIAGGQFFMISGLWMALTALIRFNRSSNWRLATAGIFWALAIGTRQSLAAPIGFIALHVGYRLVKSKYGLLTKTGSLISLGLPLTLGLLCLGWYNWARFGSITETGLYYQLAEPYIRSFYDKLFSPAYLIQNLYNYLLNPPELTPGFPFVFMAKGSINPILPYYALPEFYNAQPITGMIFIFPFMVFAVTPLVRLLSHQFKDKRLKIMSNDLDQLPLNWVVFTLGGACLIALFLLMGFFWAGMRYAEDFMLALTIISILGFWQGYDQFSIKKSFTKKAYSFAGVVLAALSITFSLLLVISTNSRLVNLIIHRFPFLQ